MDKDGYIAGRLFISKYLCIDASLSQGTGKVIARASLGRGFAMMVNGLTILRSSMGASTQCFLNTPNRVVNDAETQHKCRV